MTNINQKELMREKRRKAYLERKLKMQSDPKYLALKEHQRMLRKEAYQNLKEQKLKQKTELKIAKKKHKTSQRDARDQELLKQLFPASNLTKDA